MQPWDFIVIRDLEVRRKVKRIFETENAKAAQNYSGERRALYDSLKLEGILESPLNLCVACDRARGGIVLGRSSILDTDLFSTCCAVQNLWLAARAEGIGVGWVSILDNAGLSTLLGLPLNAVPIAYLCLGYPDEFPRAPMLETVGWRQRLALEEVVHDNRYGQHSLLEL